MELLDQGSREGNECYRVSAVSGFMIAGIYPHRKQASCSQFAKKKPNSAGLSHL